MLPSAVSPLPRALSKIVVTALIGTIAYTLTELTNQPRIWSLTITVFIGGITFIVQFLIDVDGRLQESERKEKRLHNAVKLEVSKLGKASQLCLIETSALSAHTITNLVEQAANIDRQTPPLVRIRPLDIPIFVGKRRRSYCGIELSDHYCRGDRQSRPIRRAAISGWPTPDGDARTDFDLRRPR